MHKIAFVVMVFLVGRRFAWEGRLSYSTVAKLACSRFYDEVAKPPICSVTFLTKCINVMARSRVCRVACDY